MRFILQDIRDGGELHKEDPPQARTPHVLITTEGLELRIDRKAKILLDGKPASISSLPQGCECEVDASSEDEVIKDVKATTITNN